jgi:hypothetical protein
MKTIEISKAEGRVLDWLVAKCEGATNLRHCPGMYEAWVYTVPKNDDFPKSIEYLANIEYSTDWAQGGPIIEREKISLSQFNTKTSELLWSASAFWVKRWACGTTPLIAAMRCYCISKMGATAEVPEELL